VVGLVLIAIGGFITTKEFALGDVLLLAENLAGRRLNRGEISYFRHSFWFFYPPYMADTLLKFGNYY
jgi:hypothetical protein